MQSERGHGMDDDTERALIQAACEHWSERDVKLRLSDFLAERGQQERSEFVAALVNYEWKSEPDPIAGTKPRHVLTNGTNILAVISPYRNSDKLMVLWADEVRFYSGDAPSLTEGQTSTHRFLLSGSGKFSGANGLTLMGKPR